MNGTRASTGQCNRKKVQFEYIIFHVFVYNQIFYGLMKLCACNLFANWWLYVCQKCWDFFLFQRTLRAMLFEIRALPCERKMSRERWFFFICVTAERISCRQIVKMSTSLMGLSISPTGTTEKRNFFLLFLLQCMIWLNNFQQSIMPNQMNFNNSLNWCTKDSEREKWVWRTKMRHFPFYYCKFYLVLCDFNFPNLHISAWHGAILKIGIFISIHFWPLHVRGMWHFVAFLGINF